MGKHNEQPIERRAATHLLHVAFFMKTAIESLVHGATGMLLADNEALLNLHHEDGSLRMSDIADRLILSKGGTTKVVDRLETKGLVTRQPDPKDRRALLVSITPLGEEMLATIRPIVDDAIQQYWGQHISAEEAETIVDVSDRVIAANSEWLG